MINFTAKELELLSILEEASEEILQKELHDKLSCTPARVSQLIIQVNNKAKEVSYISEDIIKKRKDIVNGNWISLDKDTLSSIYVDDVLLQFDGGEKMTIDDISYTLGVSPNIVSYIVASLLSEDNFIREYNKPCNTFGITPYGAEAIKYLKEAI